MYQLIQDLLKRPIAFHRVFAGIMGCAAGGLFLSQLYYWSIDRKAHDPENFIYKTLDEWQSETSISRREWEKARQKLKSLGLLEEQRRGLNPQLWYKLDVDLLYETIVKNSQNPRGSGIATSDISQRKIEHHPTLHLTSPDAISDLRSISTENTDQRVQTEITHTDPERAREKFEVKNFQPSDPETMPSILENSSPDRPTSLQQSISGEKELSAACRTTETNSITTTNNLTRFEQRYSPTLSRQQLAEITQACIDTYNKTKPSCWGTCTQITAYLTSQVTKLLEIYQQDLEIDRAVESLKNDLAAAHLSCKGDEFYDNPKFGIPSIAFFLDPKRIDKLRNRAQVWYDRPQQQKEQLAHRMVRDAIDGIPSWESGTILTGLRLSLAKTRYRDWYEANDPQCPSIDYLQQYFPQILGAN